MAGQKRKTRKLSHKRVTGIFSIPELRRSFEHIETYMGERIHSKLPKHELVKDLQREWKNTFLKELDSDSAEAYVEHLITTKKDRRRTMKHHKGGMAPLDYTTRAGVYLEPAAIPPNTQFPVLKYVSSGFFNPEPAHNLDPIPGQTRFPTSVPVGMGDNTVHFKGGKRSDSKRSDSKHSDSKRSDSKRSDSKHVRGLGKRRTRKLRGGLQLPQRMIPATNPPGALHDAQSAWKGQQLGQSPDITQNTPTYKLGSIIPAPIKLSTTF